MGRDSKLGGMTDDTRVIRLDEVDEPPAPAVPMKATPLPAGPRPWLAFGEGGEDDDVAVITKPLVIVGRVENVADIVIADDDVSRHHAAIGHCDGVWSIYDMGSTNGTFVDGKRIQHIEIRDGARLRFGNVEVIFRTG